MTSFLTSGLNEHLATSQVLQFLTNPRQKRWAKVEADSRIVVDDLINLVAHVENARHSVWRITFGRDAFVPVVKFIGESCSSTYSSHAFSRGG